MITKNWNMDRRFTIINISLLMLMNTTGMTHLKFQFFEFYVRGTGKNGEITIPDSWKTFHSSLKNKLKLAVELRKLGTKLRKHPETGSQGVRWSLWRQILPLNTSPPVFPHATSFSLFLDVYYHISLLRLLGQLVVLYLYGHRYESRRTNKFTLWWNLSRPSQHLCPAAKSVLQSPFGPCSTGSHRDPRSNPLMVTRTSSIEPERWMLIATPARKGRS